MSNTKSGLSVKDLIVTEENALPHGWEQMNYEDFLVARRKLMATKIKQAFEVLRNNVRSCP